MQIQRCFGLSQMIVDQITKVWKETRAESPGLLPFVNYLSNRMDSTGPRSARGFYLIFNECSPVSLVTPFGTWTFSCPNPEDMIIARLRVFSFLIKDLGLEEAGEDFPKTDKTFTYKVGKVGGVMLPPAIKGEPQPFNQDDENRWSMLVIERINSARRI